VRYWGYFAAKLAIAGAALYGLLVVWSHWFPPSAKTDLPLAALGNGGTALACNFALMLWFLLCAGTVYLVIRDQRYRCRVCLHRLCMPVVTGSWGRMLQFGRPRIEYICPYGHGTLKWEEVQISGLENPRWTPHSGDMWEELCASSKKSGGKP
jgi:hypothetical protein